MIRGSVKRAAARAGETQIVQDLSESRGERDDSAPDSAALALIPCELAGQRHVYGIIESHFDDTLNRGIFF